MNSVEIGIVDTRNIIRTIQDVYGYDFSNYALTSLKRRLEKIIEDSSLASADNLNMRLREDKPFFDDFLKDISVETTEMFRDPSLWRTLRDETIPGLMNDNLRFRIWIPVCVSGDELYSLAILLREMDCLHKVEIIASSFCERCIENIKQGVFSEKKYEISAENYRRFQGASEFEQYVKINGKTAVRDTSLLESTSFIRQNIIFDSSPRDVKLILFRNKIIYYNPGWQDKVLQIMHKSLSPKGHLIIGAKEKIRGNALKDYIVMNESENIFKKKFN